MKLVLEGDREGRPIFVSEAGTITRKEHASRSSAQQQRVIQAPVVRVAFIREGNESTLIFRAQGRAAISRSHARRGYLHQTPVWYASILWNSLFESSRSPATHAGLGIMATCLAGERRSTDPRRRPSGMPSEFEVDMAGLAEGTGQWENMQGVLRR